ncbi:hypothetical protein EU546_06785 [Candidatus Thorarchaeota archaeon]|nr:MAG: hypothetical protein EU546_06785 [Candidatus Thorarchaeota archaeon]
MVLWILLLLRPQLNLYAQAEDSHVSGPYIDKLVYRVIPNESDQIDALQNGDIDIIGDFIQPRYTPTLAVYTGVDVDHTPENGYGYIVINCEEYPMNITAFRRAFAFALDKWAISDYAWDGLSVPQDSSVPQGNAFSVEGQLPYSYYEANAAFGNQLLDDAGFIDLDKNGYRETPNGSNLDVRLEVNIYPHEALCEIFRDAFESLNVSATVTDATFSTMTNMRNGLFDMVAFHTTLPDLSVDWLAYEYWSEYASEPQWNYARFRNGSYDSWRETILYSTDYEEVEQAARRMQEIWTYECPAIVCYEKTRLSAHRGDRFEGHANDLISGVPCWWTNHRVHLKSSEGGPFGGEFRWGISSGIDSFNFMASTSSETRNVLQMLYSPLLRYSPDGRVLPWLVESYEILTHENDESVPVHHTRFVLDMVRNATWTDGEPLTAYDVAFTYCYYRDSYHGGNPYGAGLQNLTAAYAMTPYKVALEFESPSYWHIYQLVGKPIIPRHIFEGIGVEDWNVWEPAIPPAGNDSLVTSGPFVISTYTPGISIELEQNPDYFRAPRPKVESPVPDSSKCIEIEYGASEVLRWSVNGAKPLSYSAYRNRTVIDSGSTTADFIEIDLDGLDVGAYNYTLHVEGARGLSSADTVFVKVSVDEEERDVDPLAFVLHPVSLLITLTSVAVMLFYGHSLIEARRKTPHIEERGSSCTAQ